LRAAVRLTVVRLVHGLRRIGHIARRAQAKLRNLLPSTTPLAIPLGPTLQVPFVLNDVSGGTRRFSCRIADGYPPSFPSAVM
jgi:hypothetical protein